MAIHFFSLLSNNTYFFKPYLSTFPLLILFLTISLLFCLLNHLPPQQFFLFFKASGRFRESDGDREVSLERSRFTSTPERWREVRVDVRIAGWLKSLPAHELPAPAQRHTPTRATHAQRVNARSRSHGGHGGSPL